MIPVLDMIQQRTTHHSGYDELKDTEDLDPAENLKKFLNEFGTGRNAKEKEIPNSYRPNLGNAIVEEGEETGNGVEARKTGKSMASCSICPTAAIPFEVVCPTYDRARSLVPVIWMPW